MIRKTIRVILGLILAVLLSVTVYLAAVMGTPQTQEKTEHQPTAASAPVTITEISELTGLRFPARFLALADGSGWTFAGGDAYDIAFAGGIARRLDLRWTDDAGGVMTCTTVYPPQASEWIEQNGYELTSGRPTTVAGIPMIRTKKGDLIRFSTSGEDAAYAVTLPERELRTAGLVMLMSPGGTQ